MLVHWSSRSLLHSVAIVSHSLAVTAHFHNLFRHELYSQRRLYKGGTLGIGLGHAAVAHHRGTLALVHVQVEACVELLTPMTVLFFFKSLSKLVSQSAHTITGEE